MSRFQVLFVGVFLVFSSSSLAVLGDTTYATKLLFQNLYSARSSNPVKNFVDVADVSNALLHSVNCSSSWAEPLPVITACDTSYLCQTSPLYSPLKFFNSSASAKALALSSCCHSHDTGKPEECRTSTARPTCREVGTNAPFCDASGNAEKCSEKNLILRNAKLSLNIASEKDDNINCCPHCSCSSDGSCLSLINEQTTLATDESWQIIYMLDEYGIEAKVVDIRGITEVKFRSSNKIFILNYLSCWQNSPEKAWLTDSGLVFPINDQDDISFSYSENIWHIFDKETTVLAQIQCFEHGLSINQVTEQVPRERRSHEGLCFDSEGLSLNTETETLFVSTDIQKSRSCANHFSDLPKKLANCEEGVEIQYLRDSGNPDLDNSWVTHFVIPQNYLPCEGRIELLPADAYPLFIYPIRFRQCQDPSCTLKTCEQQASVEVDINFLEDSPETTDLLARCVGQDLCSQENQVIGDFITGINDELLFNNLSMPPCCSVRDLQFDTDDICEAFFESEVLSGTSFLGQQCRTLAIEDAFCSPSDFTKNCTSEALIPAQILLELKFSEPEEECCLTCSCYGDPHCVSFDNVYDIWVICDARTPKSSKNNMCYITEAECSTLIDHEGNECSWQTNSDGTDWSIPFQGSPCVQNIESGSAWLEMYKADGYGVRIIQGERSIIELVEVNLHGSLFTITAEDCMENDSTTSWKLLNSTNIAGNSVFDSSFLRVKEFEEVPDIIWIVHDYHTGIRLQLRCTAPVIGDELGKPFINVEAVMETDEYFRINRTDVGGFCATNVLNKVGSTHNTESIVNGEGCQMWGQDDAADLEILRLLCSNPTLSLQGSTSCKLSFCSAYFFPSFKDEISCFNSLEKSLGDGFCTAFTSTERNRDECVNSIRDFGWEATINRYMKMNQMEQFRTKRELPLIYMSGSKSLVTTKEKVYFDEFCVSLSTQLPTTLSKCQSGVLVQYKDDPTDENSWITYVAIPSNVRLCPDFSFTGKLDEVLFTHPMRLKQCSISESCAMNYCGPQIGIDAQITVSNIPTSGITPPDRIILNATTFDGNVQCKSGSFNDLLDGLGSLDNIGNIGFLASPGSNDLAIVIPSLSLYVRGLAFELCDFIGRMVNMSCEELSMKIKTVEIDDHIKADIILSLNDSSKMQRIFSDSGMKSLQQFFTVASLDHSPSALWFFNDPNMLASSSFQLGLVPGRQLGVFLLLWFVMKL